MNSLLERDLKMIDMLCDELDEIKMKREELILSKERTNELIKIVEKFTKDKKLIIYGGSATHYYLQKKTGKGIYEKVTDIDVFSKDSYKDALDLVKILSDNDYKYIRITERFHRNTFGVWCEFNSIYDLTLIDKVLYDYLLGEKIDGFEIVNLDFHLTSIFLELDYPGTNTYRWKKQFDRLNLLIDNNVVNYPLSQKLTNTQKSSELLINIKNEIFNYLLKEYKNIIITGLQSYNVMVKYTKKSNVEEPRAEIYQVVYNNLDEIIRNKEILTNKVEQIVGEKNDKLRFYKVGGFMNIIPGKLLITYDEVPLIEIFNDVNNCVSYNEIESLKFTNFFYTMKIISAYYFMSQCKKYSFNDKTKYILDSEKWGVLSGDLLRVCWNHLEIKDDSVLGVFGSKCIGRIIDRGLNHKIENIKNKSPFKFKNNEKLEEEIKKEIVYYDENIDNINLVE